MFAIIHDESVKVYIHMYNGNVQENPLCVESCVTKKFSISPRLWRTIFDPDANSVLLRAYLCTAVDSMRRNPCVRCLYRPDSVRLDTRRLKHVFVTSGKGRKKKITREEQERRSAKLGNTKETLGVPTSLDNFPTTAVAPYWINQRLQSKMYHQTPSLHRNERHRCTSCAVSSNNS